MIQHRLIGVILLTCLASLAPAADFALRDGDTVAFLGDSITAVRTYGKIIENYTLLRFPERKVRFINVGWGGDTAVGGLARLDRDVFQNKTTVLIVAYGVNDIGWGMHADNAHKKAYLDAIRGIVQACVQRKIRVYICSAAITSENPDKAANGFLQTMCDEGLTAARIHGGESIDVQRAMRDIQRRVIAANDKVDDKSKHTSLHAADGVHLNDLGQLAMAFAILKGLGAPAVVSNVEIDAATNTVVQSTGCHVSNLGNKGNSVSFIRLDEGLPFNYGIFYALNFRFVPVPEELNRYLLKVTNLPGDRYEIVADSRIVGTLTAKQLAQGVNIASMTANAWEPGGPWNAQANLLHSVTEARHQIAVAKTMAPKLLREGDTSQTMSDQADKLNADLETMQRLLARPQRYRFVVRPAPPATDKKTNQ